MEEYRPLEKRQILVIGYGSDNCTEHAYNTAYTIGEEIARRGAILVTGGLGGVMEAASKGAKAKNGLVVGIIPQNDKFHANPYCDVVIPTGLGHIRNFITAYSADAVIVIGGGAGTATEAYATYIKGKPIIAVIGSGGTADRIADTYLDDRRLVEVVGEANPREAVKKAFNLINQDASNHHHAI